MKKIETIINRYRHNMVTTSSDLESNENVPVSKTQLKKAIESKTNSSEEEIKRLRNDSDVTVKNAELLTEAIKGQGQKFFEAVYKNDRQFIKDNMSTVSLLEVIVRTDGSRPSFLIKNGTVDLSTAPFGLWNNILVANKDLLDRAISCVGRVDKFGVHLGSGFLLSPNIFATNRHVFQDIGSKDSKGKTTYDDATINFGYEYEGILSLNPREIKGVIFDCGNEIDRMLIDHDKIDVVLLELSPIDDGLNVPQLNFSKTAIELKPGAFMYTMGYPGNPGLAGLSVYGQVLEDLYKSTYGFKRLSPGEIIINTEVTASHTISHDASTLGGNSGSVIIGNNKLTAASAIHYGGTLKTPRENWGLLLDTTLEVKDKKSGQSLSEILSSNKVIIE